MELAEAKLTREFFSRNALIVARELLGCILVHESAEGKTSGIVVETEAYRGPDDRAAHSFRGRRTTRTEVMFGPAGHAYVYLIYGMHECLNVVVGSVGLPEAVLLRALEPLEGIELMLRRRGLHGKSPRVRHQLCSGPGKLTQAMNISRAAHYGIDLCDNVLYFLRGKRIRDDAVAATARINVDYAEEWRDLPWRFVVRDSPYLSVRWRPRA